MTSFPYRLGLALTLLVAITLHVFGWNGICDIGERLIGGSPDTISFLWIFDRLGGNIVGFQRALFDGKMFYPSHESLIFSETMVLSSFFHRLLFWMTGDRIAAFNLVVLLFFFANFGCTYLFTRRFLSRWAATVASLIFAIGMIRMGRIQLGHIHLIPQFPFPLLGLALWEYEKRSRRGWLFAAAAALALQFYLSISLGMILLLSLIPYNVIRIWKKNDDRKRFLAHASLATLLLVALVAPIALPYLSVSRGHGFIREKSEAANYSFRMDALLMVPEGHAYDPVLGSPKLHKRLDHRHERVMFLGLLGWALIGVLLYSRRKKKSKATFWSVVIVVSILFALWLGHGPHGGLYRWLYPWFPGMKGIRTPARFSLTFLFFGCILIGMGVDAIVSRWGRGSKRRILAGFTIVVLVFVENRLRIPMDAVPNALSGTAEFLRQTPDRQPVLSVPFGPIAAQDVYRMYYSLIHEHPIANGYCGFYPNSHLQLRERLSKNGENPKIFDELRSEGFRYFVVERDILSPGDIAQWQSIAKKHRLRPGYEDAHAIVYDLEN